MPHRTLSSLLDQLYFKNLWSYILFWPKCGLLNQILIKIGLVLEPVSFLYSRSGIFLGLIYNYLPFTMTPIYSALEKFDDTLREAAENLGANRYQVLWYVLLPYVKRAILVGSLFVFIPILGEYLIPEFLGGGKESFLGNLIAHQFFVSQNWPFSAALSCTLTLIFFLALVLRYRWSLF